MAYPKKVQPKFLNKSELSSLYDIMRLWSDPYRTHVAKLIKHIASLQIDITNLEREVTDLKLIKFQFEKERHISAPSIKDQNLIEDRLKRAPEKYPLPKRLANFKFNQQIGSETWKLVLKWNRLTDEQALEIIRQYEASR